MTFNKPSFILGIVTVSAIGALVYYHKQMPTFDNPSFVLGTITISAIGALGYYYKKSQQLTT